MEDSDIIIRIKKGEPEAFSILVERYHRRLLTFIFRLVDDERIVEDIGQEVFLSVYKSLDAFDERRGMPFSAWLFIIARNRCISEIRRRKGRVMIPLDNESAIPSKHKTTEDLLIENEQWQAIRASLAELAEPFKGTILRSLAGEPPEAIAMADGISLGTVKSRLFRARERLKTLVGEYFGGNDDERV
ncbi:MAG: sigma-70 family RNA polymerase sigma factor [Nitrospirota bacterium]